MTLSKSGLSKQDRTYGQHRSLQVHQSSSQISDSGKSNQAARMAQTLGSERSWADTYAPQTPAGSVATPTASIVDADERQHLLRGQEVADDPPPAYDDSGSQSPSQVRPVVDNRSMPQNVRSIHDWDEEVEGVMYDDREHLQLTDELEAAQSPATRCRKRRKASLSEITQRQRRMRMAFLFMAFVLLCIMFMGRQAIPALKEAYAPIPLPARNYTRHESSQSISGTFTFYDLLDLSTQSGSIRIVIDPQPGEKPAVLRLSSASGSIRVELADTYRKHLTEKGYSTRPWDTVIKSSSGSIRAKLPVGGGSNTVMQSQSGSITATLLASDVGPHDNISTLSTESTSGTQTIAVQPMLGITTISNLVAKHHVSGSASMRISYPQAWQGVLHASVGGSASVNVKGEDLRFQHNGDRDVYAWRGEGQALDVRGDGSGSIKVDCSSSS